MEGENSFKKIVLKNGPKRREGRGELSWALAKRGGRRGKVCFDRDPRSGRGGVSIRKLGGGGNVTLYVRNAISYHLVKVHLAQLVLEVGR